LSVELTGWFKPTATTTFFFDVHKKLDFLKYKNVDF
jgi:hypothetical protein